MVPVLKMLMTPDPYIKIAASFIVKCRKRCQMVV